MTNSYASDSDDIKALRQELNLRNAAILKMQNTISQQDHGIRILEDQLSKLGTLYDSVLDPYYIESKIFLEKKLKLCQYLYLLTFETNNTWENFRGKELCTEADSFREHHKKVFGASKDVKAKALFMDAMSKSDNNKGKLVGLQELITKHNDSALTPYAYYEMGKIYYRMGVLGPMKDKEKNYAKAKENFLSFLSITKFKDSHMWVLRANSFYRLGQILEQKDPGRAKKYFTLAVLQYQQATSAIKIREIEISALIAETKLKILEINKYSSSLDVL